MDRRVIVGLLLAAIAAPTSEGRAVAQGPEPLGLPQPRIGGRISVEQAMRERRSVRQFLPAAVTLTEVSQLLWAAQGVTGSSGQRTAPSAGALYPLTVYLAAGRVAGLEPGVYRYEPVRHRLFRTGWRDRRAEISAAANQRWVGQAAAVLVIAANPTRSAARYGVRGERYALIEVGHAAQNVHLQGVALGLGVTDVGAFDDVKVKDILDLSAADEPVLLLPFGRPRR
jgi:SagB-type dehydrogenase family enzyme